MAKKSKKFPKKEPESSETIEKSQSADIISKLVLLASLAVVFILLTAVIFPALYTSSTSVFNEQSWYSTVVNSFEIGMLTIPLIAINAIIFGIGFLVYKKNSDTIINLIKKIQGFDVSKKVTFIIIVILLIIYVAGSAQELSQTEEFVDVNKVQKQAENWSIDSIDSFDLHVRYFLLSTSVALFGNIRVIPFLASISLLVLTFFVTKKITNKRFPGIVSMILLMQSNLFLSYDTVASYTNFWILFYLFSIYLILKKWQFSILSFLVSIPSKTLTFAFFPMSLFFIFRSDIPRKQKIYTGIIYGIVIGIIVAAVSALGINLTYGQTVIQGENFWQAFASMASQLRFDVIVVIFLLPVIVGLFLISKKGIITADSISILITGSLVVLALVVTFTNQTTQPYRMIPLVVFFAIGAGILLSRKSTQDE